MISPMRSDKYWAARAAKRMDYTMKDAQDISNRIGRAYNEALRDIQSQLDSIFRNFSDGISQAEAVRILNQVSIGRSSSVTDMLKQALDLVSDPEDRAKLLAEINAPAYKYRMQRLKELAEDAGKKCAEIARTTRSELDSGLAEIVRDSYLRGIFDMQQGTGLAFSFSKISDRQVREILSQDWSGAHYSKRIWQNTNALAGELQNTLLKGVLTGASSGRMANEIQQRFHASYSRALTLTRTESSHCANSAELRRYEETGVKKYRYVATLDSHTSDVCQELDGQEFPVEDASPGTNYPPMHPRCRSTTIAAISPALMQKLERRARDPETGELMTVPADMTYREWYGKYVGSGELTDRANKSAPEKISKSASDSSILSRAEPISHTSSEYAEIERYADEKGIKIHAIKEFDGDVSILKEQIDAIAEIRAEYGIKKKITIVFSELPDNDLAQTGMGADTITFNKKALRNREITEAFLTEDKTLATDNVKGIAYHEMGHVISYVYGEKGLDIAMKAYYNIFKEEISPREMLNWLRDNISIYSAFIPPNRAEGIFKAKKFREVTPEIMSLDKTNPNRFSNEFVRLLKEAYGL